MMLEQALGKWASDLAIDLGTANTLICVRGRGIVLEEPSVVAVRRTGGEQQPLDMASDAASTSRSKTIGRVVAVGTEALRMVGRTPENITTVRPIQAGVIQDFELAETLLEECVHRALPNRSLLKPRMVLSIPHDTSDVQRRAVVESARKAGAREVHLLEKSIAAAVGTGLPIHEPRGNLVVDIGAGTTEIGVLSLGGTIVAGSAPIGGQALDNAIIEWVRDQLGVLIGERTAEKVKLTIGCATNPDEAGIPNRTAKFHGRDIGSGIPRQVQLSSQQTAKAMERPLHEITEALRRQIAGLSPELSADIAEQGIVLCGGTALLPGLVAFLRARTGMPVVVAEDPQRAVAIGAGRLLEDSQKLARLSLSLH
jgi:rod shape-determining protein MreB